MGKIIHTFSVLLLFNSLYVVWVGAFASELEKFESMQLYIGGKSFRLEIADTPKRRKQGLMFRPELSIRGGMVFVYAQSGDYRIWMKNTRIPLTVVWVDDKATVIGIKKLRPCRQVNCPSYGVQSASKYIIEFNVNFDDLKPGDRLPAILDLKVQ